MRKAFRVAIEVDEINLHWLPLSASTPARLASGAALILRRNARSDLHLRAEFDDAIGRQVEEVRRARGLFRHGDEQFVLPQGMPELGAVFSVRRPGRMKSS